MAVIGKLGNAAPAATTLTTVYTVPASTVATFNLTIVNTTATPIAFRVGISATATPTSAEWIEYDATIQPNDVYERTALVASTGENVVVYGSILGLAVRVYGFEQ
jgi:hypothetical protein